MSTKKTDSPVTEADRKQALAMIEEKLASRDKLLEECVQLADEFGVTFTAANTGEAPNDTYLPQKYLDRLDAGELDENEDEEYGDEGWQRGWQSSWC